MYEREVSQLLRKAADRIREQVRMEDAGIWLFQEKNTRRWLCPFHEDHHPGSVSSYDEGRRFHCFSCGADGDVLQLVMQVKHCDFIYAVYLISARFAGILNDTEFTQLADAVHGDRNRRPTGQMSEAHRETKETERAPFYLLDLVYRFFIQGKKLLYPDSDVLTVRHYQYLRTRGITPSAIRENQYFTMPGREVLPALKKNLERQNYTEDILIGVPGFYRRKSDHQIDMSVQPGIGIPIHNVQGQIIAIQIRRDTPGRSRYIWYSSRCEGHPEREEGVSSGSPQDVLMSAEDNERDILITEGHFKADAFRRYGHCSAISVQGVASHREIAGPLQELVHQKKKTCRILIGFDSDMCFQKAVYEQAVHMAAAIDQIAMPAVIVYLFWDYRCGKGLDDVLQNHHEDEIHMAERSDFEEVMKRFWQLPASSQEERICLFQQEVISRLPQRYLPAEAQK